MDGKSLDIKKEKIDKLKEFMPEVFTEGDKVDIEKLKLTLGEGLNVANERYVLNWAGKSDAFKVLQSPTTATLAPDKEESVNFDTTENIFIEGENLEVLKVLQKSYYGKIKMIYIDPPYNTGNDSFIYPDKFSESKEEYLKRIGEKDEEGYLLKEGLFRKNSKENGQYHSNWLNMMYPRLFLSKNLLKEDGVIFVSIDDNEVHNLKILMNEIFGEENFLAQIEWQKRYTRSNNTDNFTTVVEHILLYSKSFSFEPNLLNRNEEADNRYTNPDNDERGPWKAMPFFSQATPAQRPNLCYDIINPSTNEVIKPVRKAWRSSESVFNNYIKENRVWWGKDGKSKYPSIKRFLSEARKGMTPINFWDYKFAGSTDDANNEIKEIFSDKIFDTPKPTLLIKRMIEICSSEGENDIFLDFFAGSGTLGHSVFNINLDDFERRKFILIQMPEKTPENSSAHKMGFITISDICKERINKVIKKLNEERKNKPELFSSKVFDLGLKVFKLKYSNFKLWRGDLIESEEDLSKQMDVFENPLKESTEEENILYELILKSGYELTVKIEKKDELYLIEGDKLIIVLSKVDDKIIKSILKIKPQKCIILDSLFSGNDRLKTNTVLQMKDAGIEFKTI